MSLESCISELNDAGWLINAFGQKNKPTGVVWYASIFRKREGTTNSYSYPQAEGATAEEALRAAMEQGEITAFRIANPNKPVPSKRARALL